MRYGLLADIHEDARFLRAALDRFRLDAVDRVLVLGDVFETGRELEGTTQLLREAGAEGVWGNHDFGLSYQPGDDIRVRFSEECMAFMTSLRPRLEFEDCLVTHVEPWRDAEDIFELWSFESEYVPERSFADLRYRIMLHGHHHRWKVATPDGPVEWDCFHPLKLDPNLRYLIQVGAVCDGRCGVLNTAANVLTPIDLRDGNSGLATHSVGGEVMTEGDEVDELGAFLDAIDPGTPSNDRAIATTLDFLIGKHAPDGLAGAVLPRVGDLRGFRGELILGLIEGLARDDLLDALADAVVAQPELPPDRAWMALEVLEGTGRIEARPALVELREEIEELLAEDVAISDLAREIEDDPRTIPAALDALTRVELDIRLEIIAGLGREPASRSLIALLEGLADRGDDATRDVSAEALKSVRARHWSGGVEAANREIATAHPPPLLLASVIGPLDGEGRATIALVAARTEHAVVARFDCDVLGGLIAASLEGPFPHDAAISRWGDIAESLGPEASQECPISAWLLLTGAAWLSGETFGAGVWPALVAAFGDGFAARPIFAPPGTCRPTAEVDADIRSDVQAVLAKRPLWIDESDLARRLAVEMSMRDGNLSPDAVRDPGPFRVLFEGRVLGRIELYRRMLLWSAMVWQESGDQELSSAAKNIAEGMSDPQNAVPGYPFVEELMIRSLSGRNS